MTLAGLRRDFDGSQTGPRYILYNYITIYLYPIYYIPYRSQSTPVQILSMSISSCSNVLGSGDHKMTDKRARASSLENQDRSRRTYRASVFFYLEGLGGRPQERKTLGEALQKFPACDGLWLEGKLLVDTNPNLGAWNYRKWRLPT